MDEAERRNPAALSEELKKLLADKIVKLKICETSRLKLDANVMHPFVKYKDLQLESISSIKTQDATYKIYKRPSNLQSITMRS